MAPRDLYHANVHKRLTEETIQLRVSKMMPDIFPKELTDIYLGLIVCVVGLIVLIITIAWLHRSTFSYRVRPSILLLQKGQYSDAAKLLAELSLRFPNHIAIHILRAGCLEQIEAYQSAQDATEQATAMLKRPGVVESTYVTSMIRQMPRLRDLSYREAIQSWLEEMSSTLEILKAYQACDYQQALHFTEKVIGSTVLSHAKLLAWKAHFLLLLKDIARSGTVLSEAERIVPVDQQVPIIRGHWYLVQGETNAAITRYREHTNRKSIEEDLRHISKVFGIKPPSW